jgi:hypothetical protein
MCKTKKVWTSEMIDEERSKHADRKKEEKAAKQPAAEYREKWQGIIGADPQAVHTLRKARKALTVKDKPVTNTPVVSIPGTGHWVNRIEQRQNGDRYIICELLELEPNRSEPRCLSDEQKRVVDRERRRLVRVALEQGKYANNFLERHANKGKADTLRRL